jgi:serpin B
MRSFAANPHRRTALIALLLILSALLPLAGCQPGGETALAEPADHVDPCLVQANTNFAFELFHTLQKEKPGKNLFISPASVSLALAMTYNGAAGETAAAMAKVLQFGEMELEQINAAFADLRTILQNPDPKVVLAVANSLWTRQGQKFYDDFLQRNRDYYGAEVAELDFDRPDAAATINRWVEQQTAGRIKELIEAPIDPLTVLFLINALYFKADWTEPFDPDRTREIPFNLQGGSSKDHPVMFKEGQFSCLEREGFQAVSLPYGKTKRLSIYLFLPDAAMDLDSFYAGLTPENWSSWIKQFQDEEAVVGLPRFKFEDEASLKSTLKAMGMEIAFTAGAADFSKMKPVPPGLFIAEIKHKTFVEVNEKGTEAAAATSVEVRDESAPAFCMIMDRPFFFIIVDNKTGAILFMGQVTEPLQ